MLFDYSKDKREFDMTDMEQKPVYTFFRFSKIKHEDGSTNEIADEEISKWVEMVYNDCLETGEFSTIGSGNTCVIALPYEDEIQVIVAKNYDEYSIER